MLVKTIVCAESWKKQHQLQELRVSYIFHGILWVRIEYARLCENQSPRLNLMVFVVRIKTQKCMQCINVYSLHLASLQTEYTLCSIQEAIACAPTKHFIEYALRYVVAGRIAPNIFEYYAHCIHVSPSQPFDCSRNPFVILTSTFTCVHMSRYARHIGKHTKKARAENHMQKHKIIVVVKSFVHNREWQRNYQV